MNINITIHGLTELESRLATVQVPYQAAVRRFLTRSALEVQAQAQQRTPAAGFNTVKYSTGTLRRSITTQVDSASFPRWAKVGTALPYGSFIETGVRSDPRVRFIGPRAPTGAERGGLVFRRLGAARMFADGVKAAMPRIEGFAKLMVSDISHALRGN